MNLSELTELCKNRRIEMGLTQTQLGEKIKLPKARISEFENNRANLQCDTLLELLTALNLTVVVVNETTYVQLQEDSTLATPEPKKSKPPATAKPTSPPIKDKVVKTVVEKVDDKELTKAELLKQMLRDKK